MNLTWYLATSKAIKSLINDVETLTAKVEKLEEALNNGTKKNEGKKL